MPAWALYAGLTALAGFLGWTTYNASNTFAANAGTAAGQAVGQAANRVVDAAITGAVLYAGYVYFTTVAFKS